MLSRLDPPKKFSNIIKTNKENVVNLNIKIKKIGVFVVVIAYKLFFLYVFAYTGNQNNLVEFVYF